MKLPGYKEFDMIKDLAQARPSSREREFFIHNLQVRIHFIIVMIRWTGLAPWEPLIPKPRKLQSLNPENPLKS